MKMQLEPSDIGDAILEYLGRRGINVKKSQLTIHAAQGPSDTGWEFFVEVKEVNLTETGPYR